MKQDKRQLLLDAVKAAVARYGTEKASTRVIAEIAGVSDSHIYRFFNDRENLIAEAYRLENDRYIRRVTEEINHLHLETDIHLEEATRKVFREAWSLMLQDPEFCAFTAYYYHSPMFVNSRDFHQKQVEEVVASIIWLCDDRESATQCAYALFALVYDFGKQVVDGRLPNDEVTERQVYQIFYNILINNSNRSPGRLHPGN